MANKTFGVTLLGCGTVGGGVVNILTQQAQLLKQRTGIEFRLAHVAVRSEADYPPNADQLPMTTDGNAAIDDPTANVVIELIGGCDVALKFVQRALKLGKPVITANKALLARHGCELFRLAHENNTCIAFEASAGGGIPIIDVLQRGLIANRADALVGIVNGTCNFILSQMSQKGWSYEQALKEAQAQGFAEANPAMDVSGNDSLQKLAILAGLAFNVQIEESDIHLEGIDTLNAVDIKYASELGYTIKLLAIAERQNGSLASSNTAISLRVHPTLIHQSELLAQTPGSFNAISFYGHALGHAMFYGRGAGRMPTASAVLADLVGVAMGTTQIQFQQLNIFCDRTPRATVLPFSRLHSRYYLRVTATDQPGVMAAISSVLGSQGISLSAIHQHESLDEGASIPIVITTHLANEGAVQSAIAQINMLPTITAPTVCLRIMDQPKEFAQYSQT